MPKVVKKVVRKYVAPYIPAVNPYANEGEGKAQNFVVSEADNTPKKYINPLFNKNKRYIATKPKEYGPPPTLLDTFRDAKTWEKIGETVLPMLPFLLL